MKLFKHSRGSDHTNFMEMSKKLVAFSCLIGGALLSVCASAHADWQYVGLLKNYSKIPNFDACQYRAEIVYPTTKGGPTHSDSVIFTSRYKFRDVGTGEGLGTLDALEGRAPSSMSNHIFSAGLGEYWYNVTNEFIHNKKDSGGTFKITMGTVKNGKRWENMAYIFFAHPASGELVDSWVNPFHVKLFENCTGATSLK